MSLHGTINEMFHHSLCFRLCMIFSKMLSYQNVHSYQKEPIKNVFLFFFLIYETFFMLNIRFQLNYLFSSPLFYFGKKGKSILLYQCPTSFLFVITHSISHAFRFCFVSVLLQFALLFSSLLFYFEKNRKVHYFILVPNFIFICHHTFHSSCIFYTLCPFSENLLSFSMCFPVLSQHSHACSQLFLQFYMPLLFLQ